MNSSLLEIAKLIRRTRLARGLTQIELAEQARVSLRSVQRIENASVSARAHTLKVLANTLGIELPLAEALVGLEQPTSINPREAKVKVPSHRLYQAIILGVCITLFGLAFLLQAPNFPESTFELCLFWASVSTFYLCVLIMIFRREK